MSSMKSNWVDVQIVSPVDAGELLSLLDDPNVQGAWQDGETIHLYWAHHVWSPDHLVRLRKALHQLDGTGDVIPEILVQSLPNQDWNTRWAQSVRPLWVGKRIVVRPTWENVPSRPEQIEIILDPKQAFGTGHHATTRMLLEWLEEIVAIGDTVLDVGTGSGLLAMAALRLGAARALGIDNDPVAIDCAREYAQLNHFGEELALQCGTLDRDQSYDLVLANLDRQTLLSLAEPLAACTARMLLVSGLLLEQAIEIAEAFARFGFYPVGQREREGWIAIAYTRGQSCERGEL